MEPRLYSSIDDPISAKVQLSPSETGVMPSALIDAGTSAPINLHDPIGWMLKRLGLLFLVAVTIALVLLIALPHGHASVTPQRGHALPKPFPSGTI